MVWENLGEEIGDVFELLSGTMTRGREGWEALGLSIHDGPDKQLEDRRAARAEFPAYYKRISSERWARKRDDEETHSRWLENRRNWHAEKMQDPEWVEKKRAAEKARRSDATRAREAKYREANRERLRANEAAYRARKKEKRRGMGEPG